jgi:uncharacterized iron-regulated protein
MGHYPASRQSWYEYPGMLDAPCPAKKHPASFHPCVLDAACRNDMNDTMTIFRRIAMMAAALAVAWTAHTSAAAALLAAQPAALAEAMRGKRIVILGEIHDNPAQHALRAAALREWVGQGARPAIAFEQFDREQQGAIDAARQERPRDADYLIAQGKGSPGWRWEFYLPFVELALEYDLPIVAANLSREAVMKLATAAPGKDEAAVDAPAVTPAFLAAHQQIIASAHCDQLPPAALPGMARAQIARDRALAQALRPHAARGVVLLTGDGHARTDLGVPFWLTAKERAQSISIGFVERDEDSGKPPDEFDAWVLTDAAERADPCGQGSGFRR